MRVFVGKKIKELHQFLKESCTSVGYLKVGLLDLCQADEDIVHYKDVIMIKDREEVIQAKLYTPQRILPLLQLLPNVSLDIALLLPQINIFDM